MIALKSFVKRLLAQALYSSGIAFALLARRSRGRLLVLTYHRVLPDSMRADCFSADGIIVTPATFERHMRLLRRKFHVMSPDEFAGALLGPGPIPPRACLVTFDDGWRDNLQFAAPILSRYRVPALLFVATDYIGTDRVFWQEQLSNLLFQAWKQGSRAGELLERLHAAHLLELSERDARHAIRELITALKRSEPAVLADAIASTTAFLERSGVAVEPSRTDRFLSWNELTALVGSSPVTIGSHACSHTPLTALDAESVVRELEHSRERIRAETGIAVNDFAYPNGDCNDEIARLTMQSGYRMAFSTQHGYAAPGDNRHRLRRINMHEHATLSDAMFVTRIAGLL